MAENVFDENVEYLKKVREAVFERDDLIKQSEQMKSALKRITKNISSEEKSIQDEISTTIKKRKNTLEDGFDKRLDQNRSKRKTVINKKEKKKNQKMNARVEDETKHIKIKNRDLETDLKSMFKKNKVPSFCRSKLYYCMFMPSGILEFFKMILGMVVIYAAIPALVTIILRLYVFKGTSSQIMLYTVIVPAALIIVFLILYFVMYTTTKVRYLEVIKEGRTIRDSIKANEKEAKAIKNSINKDKDESIYKLDSYDKKIEEIDAEADSINEEKKEALKNFEEETKVMITDEISNRRMGAVNNMKQEKKDLESKILETDDLISQKSLDITNKYESCIGEDNCKLEKLDDLIALMEEGSAETVSEALAYFKNQSPSR